MFYNLGLLTVEKQAFSVHDMLELLPGPLQQGSSRIPKFTLGEMWRFGKRNTIPAALGYGAAWAGNKVHGSEGHSAFNQLMDAGTGFSLGHALQAGSKLGRIGWTLPALGLQALSQYATPTIQRWGGAKSLNLPPKIQ